MGNLCLGVLIPGEEKEKIREEEEQVVFKNTKEKENRKDSRGNDEGGFPPPIPCVDIPFGDISKNATEDGNVPVINCENKDESILEVLQQHDWDCKFTTCILASYSKENSEDPITVNEYHMSERLGHGSFGAVYAAKRIVEGMEPRPVAIKVMSLSRLHRKKQTISCEDGRIKVKTGEDMIRNEIELLRHLFHRHVVLLFEVIESIDHDNIYLVQELLEGGIVLDFAMKTKTFRVSDYLLDYIVEKNFMHHENALKRYSIEKIQISNPDVEAEGDDDLKIESKAEDNYSMTEISMLNEALICHIFYGLMAGIVYIHSKGIVHLDIKPENLLFTEGTKLRISDFGCARQVPALVEGTEINVKVKNSAGTMAFYSPEGARGDEYDPYKQDVWAAGVTLFALMTMKLPFLGTSAEVLLKKIENESPDWNLIERNRTSTQSMSKICVDLVKQMMRKDETKRLNEFEILDHEWLKGQKEADLADA